MAILFFTNKLGEQHHNILASLIKYTDHDVKHLNIPQHRPDDHIKNGSIVVSFGKIANTLVSQYIQDKHLINVHHAQLVHPEFLLPLEKNKQYRTQAAEALNQTKEVAQEDRFNPTGLVVTEKDMPALSAIQLLLLKKLTDEAAETTCFQTTRGGKLIEIGTDHQEESKADVYLTFSEVYAIRSIMDILGVSQVDFVSSNKTTRT